MSFRRKILTKEEIERLMNDSVDENYADSDSDCDEVLLEYNSVDESRNDEADEDDATVANAHKFAEIKWKKPPDVNFKLKVLKFSGPAAGLIVPNSGDNLHCEIDFFKLIFDLEVMDVIVKETNRYAEDIIKNHLTPTNTHNTKWKPTDKNEMTKFLGLIFLMGHIDKDVIHDYWTTDELTETPIFSKTMARDRFLSLLRYLHFSDNNKKLKSDAPDYDRLWKVRDIFELLNDNFKKNVQPNRRLGDRRSYSEI